MTYKCLVLDMDDTLVTDDNIITPKTKETLIKFQEDGYILVLASGRPLQGMLKEAYELELDKFGSYLISFNGASITRMSDQEVIFKKHIELDDQNALLDYFKEKGLAALTYHEGKVMISEENDYTYIEADLTGMPMEYSADFFANLDEPMLKFIGVGHPDTVKPLEEDLGGKFGAHCNAITSKPFYLEVFHEDVSKGATLHQLANILDIGMQDIVAVGDGNNDITMIEEAGIGVAVENATDRLKAVADDITQSNNDEGVVAVVEKYFYNK